MPARDPDPVEPVSEYLTSMLRWARGGPGRVRPRPRPRGLAELMPGEEREEGIALGGDALDSGAGASATPPSAERRARQAASPPTKEPSSQGRPEPTGEPAPRAARAAASRAPSPPRGERTSQGSKQAAAPSPPRQDRQEDPPEPAPVGPSRSAPPGRLGARRLPPVPEGAGIERRAAPEPGRGIRLEPGSERRRVRPAQKADDPRPEGRYGTHAHGDAGPVVVEIGSIQVRASAPPSPPPPAPPPKRGPALSLEDYLRSRQRRA
jgi:hypothetical protein